MDALFSKSMLAEPIVKTVKKALKSAFFFEGTEISI